MPDERPPPTWSPAKNAPCGCGLPRGPPCDPSMRIRAELVEKGVVTQEDLERAVPMRLKKGEFFLFHAWVLHGSGTNRSDRRRAGLNVRFAPAGYECDDDFVYMPIQCGEVPESDRIFRTGPWAA